MGTYCIGVHREISCQRVSRTHGDKWLVLGKLATDALSGNLLMILTPGSLKIDLKTIVLAADFVLCDRYVDPNSFWRKLAKILVRVYLEDLT
jgi:hypothetical protein